MSFAALNDRIEFLFAVPSCPRAVRTHKLAKLLQHERLAEQGSLRGVRGDPGNAPGPVSATAPVVGPQVHGRVING